MFASGSLCPNSASLQEDADNLQMKEDEFSERRAMEAVKFLQTNFSKRIWGADAVKDLNARSGHYISYENSLKFIEGALLKQQIHLYRARLYELSITNPESPEIPKIKNTHAAALTSLCVFIGKAEYVD